jgi:hypothetical protein
MKIGYTMRPDFAPAAAGWGNQNQVLDLLRLIALFFCFFCFVFFFPRPAAAGEKKRCFETMYCKKK